MRIENPDSIYEDQTKTFPDRLKTEDSRNPLSAHSNDKVEMVVEERLGTDTWKFTFTENSQLGQEILPIPMTPKNGTFFDPSAHHMK